MRIWQHAWQRWYFHLAQIQLGPFLSSSCTAVLHLRNQNQENCCLAKVYMVSESATALVLPQQCCDAVAEEGSVLNCFAVSTSASDDDASGCGHQLRPECCAILDQHAVAIPILHPWQSPINVPESTGNTKQVIAEFLASEMIQLDNLQHMMHKEAGETQAGRYLICQLRFGAAGQAGGM